MIVRFVTGNPGKLREARAALSPHGVRVVGVDAPVQEIQADDVEAVARAKAEDARRRVAPPFFVEDAGLFIASLGGFPGAYSSHAFRTIGCDGMLRLLRGSRSRAATFRAVVALVEGAGPPRLFVGESPGRILEAERGRRGFGFDPIFAPRGLNRSFAEITTQDKTRRSHRGRALRRLASYLATPKTRSREARRIGPES